MINAKNSLDAQKRRLMWRCRRGMLELDIVLQRFITQYFHTLTAAQLTVFDGLLDLPDKEFWALVSCNNSRLKDVDTAQLVNQIKTLHIAQESQYD